MHPRQDAGVEVFAVVGGLGNDCHAKRFQSVDETTDLLIALQFFGSHRDDHGDSKHLLRTKQPLCDGPKNVLALH